VKEHPVSQEFRNYLSSLPNGRHQNEAAAGLNDLYLSAEQRYAEKATDEDGRGTVLALLEHARTTGQYKVVLDFQHKIEFPEHLVDDLKRDHAVKKLEGPERFFSADQNKFRERQVSQTIQASFDGAFGDGLLVFETTPTEPGEPRLAVAYGVTASGVLYYPTEQDAVPKEDRDWIVGVTYLWNVKLGLAKTEANQLAFELESNPAHEFSSRDNGLPYSFEQRYDGMAQSAFEDLGRRLFAKLSIAKVDPKQSPEQK
jgi:hypothetical protein